MVREGSHILFFYLDAVAYHFFPLFVLKASVDRVSSVSWVNCILILTFLDIHPLSYFL